MPTCAPRNHAHVGGALGRLAPVYCLSPALVLPTANGAAELQLVAHLAGSWKVLVWWLAGS